MAADTAGTRTVALQLLDEHGCVICRGFAMIWTATGSGHRERWGGEFFHLTEGTPPRTVSRGRVRTSAGDEYPVVAEGAEETRYGGTHQIRVRFGGCQSAHP